MSRRALRTHAILVPTVAVLALLAWGFTREPKFIPTPLLAKPAPTFTMTLFDDSMLRLGPTGSPPGAGGSRSRSRCARASGASSRTAGCTRHGRFVATREVRVADDGCATAPDRVARERSGNPKLRLARVPRLGEIVEVRTKLDHVFANNEGRQWEISERVRPVR